MKDEPWRNWKGLASGETNTMNNYFSQVDDKKWNEKLREKIWEKHRTGANPIQLTACNVRKKILLVSNCQA